MPLPRENTAMVYFEFVCLGTPSMFVAAASADPAGIPNGALVCCREWGFVQRCETGDGSHSPALDSAIAAGIADVGYYIHRTGPLPPEPQGIQMPSTEA
jgi:hypothetical protein